MMLRLRFPQRWEQSPGLGFPRPQTGPRIPISWKRWFRGPKTPIFWKGEFSVKNSPFCLCSLVEKGELLTENSLFLDKGQGWFLDPETLFPGNEDSGSCLGSGESQHQDRKRSRRARFQTPSSVSFFLATEFRGENSVSSSQPIICVPKRTHRVFHRSRRKTQ